MPKPCDDFFDVYATGRKAPTPQQAEDEEVRKQKESILYTQVFGTPEGEALLKFIEAKMENEDVPPYGMSNLNEYTHYCVGRRSIIRYIRRKVNASQ